MVSWIPLSGERSSLRLIEIGSRLKLRVVSLNEYQHSNEIRLILRFPASGERGVSGWMRDSRDSCRLIS